MTDRAALVLASLIRSLGDFDLAEEALQDAAVSALEHWPHDGVPDRPAAWLLAVARRKAVDRARRESARGTKEAKAAVDVDDESWEPSGPVADERLRLMFTCCHPALPETRASRSRCARSAG